MGSRRLFVGLYTASGAAALVYEVAWTRLLSLQLGHTVAAASTVLAAFMGGLAVGAWIAGRLLWRGAFSTARHGLQAYAALEILVALVALALPPALHATTPLLAWAYADGAAPAQFAMVRVVISLLLLGVPAAAMGATFPIAADWYADAGVLYAANSAGAAAGAMAAGFWLVPSIGLRATTGIGVALNVIAALGAVWMSRLQSEARFALPTPATTGRPKSANKSGPRRGGRNPSKPVNAPFPATAYPRIAGAVAAISGFAALVYEVAWTRLLALVIGPTSYAFATMATAFIGGLAIGSAIGARLARRVQQPLVWLTLMLMIGAAAAVVSAWYAGTRMPLAIAAEVADPTIVFGRVVAWQASAVIVLLLPMTLALGATFPLALAAAGGSEVSIGRNAAHVYSANTAGAIAGALVAGFVLIPGLGLRGTFQLTAACAIAGGVLCLAIAERVRPAEAVALRNTRPARPAAASALGTTIARRISFLRHNVPAVGVAAVALAAIVLLPPWDRELLASGAYKYAPYLSGGDFDTLLRAGHLEYYREGAAATVSVRRLTGTLSLAIDGKVDASNGGDMLTQRMLGLLPVVLHGHAGEICVIGLGSGVTVDSALLAGTVNRADVVEISPEVVQASHYFDGENGRVLSRTAVRLIVGDGRSHLLLTPRTYDVIVSEPSNPWMAGVASLFTREFFDAARARLKPGGLLCQWAHTYDISAADLRSIVRTFASVFPDGTLWLVGDGDLLLIGSRDGTMTSRVDRLATSWKTGTASLALTPLGITDTAAAFDLVSLFAGGPTELAAFADAAMIQTDDRTALEYSAPRAIYGRTTNDNAAAIRALLAQLPERARAVVDGASDLHWTSRGRMLLKTDAFAAAYDAFHRALAINSRNAEALSGLSDAAVGAHRQDAELAFLKAVASREPSNSAVRVELSRVLAASGDFDGAVAALREALDRSPDDPHAAEQLASVLADAGDAGRLAPMADALLQRFPDRPDARYYRASALFMQGRTEEALAEARRVVDRHPTHARAQNLVGAACATLGRRDCAESAFAASIRANPRDPSTYVNLGVFYLQTGNPRAAVDIFAEALALAPTSDAAQNGLAQARAQLSGR